MHLTYVKRLNIDTPIHVDDKSHVLDNSIKVNIAQMQSVSLSFGVPSYNINVNSVYNVQYIIFHNFYHHFIYMMTTIIVLIAFIDI